jgi:hypothetical protein
VAEEPVSTVTVPVGRSTSLHLARIIGPGLSLPGRSPLTHVLPGGKCPPTPTRSRCSASMATTTDLLSPLRGGTPGWKPTGFPHHLAR